MFLKRIYNRIPLTGRLILTTTLPFLFVFVIFAFFIPYQMDRISLFAVEESLKLAIDDVALHLDDQTAIRQPQQLNTQVVVYDTYLIPLRYYNYTYEVYPPDSVNNLEIRETPSREYRTTDDPAKNQEVLSTQTADAFHPTPPSFPHPKPYPDPKEPIARTANR